eukprot:CAMPEP_0167756740 /NCGR_PEP_ID=MMETSP0110_2-20121227/9549_1 /TAXON_ID=629695 /ORGANISM="Gymnochlora sp., Strain CCMP2014" /LENGTH=352 /DNA_ID=CAMNT_0007642875 /DNA_START=164 /DNA_END=1222 /DNA_ORIENTATION=+
MNYPGFQNVHSTRITITKDSLMSELGDTLASLQKPSVPESRPLPTPEMSLELVTKSQGIQPTALVWRNDILGNMVQMSQQVDLFKAILLETKLRVQNLLQDDTLLLSNLESLNVNGRVKSPESITRKIVFKANKAEKEGRNSHLHKVYDVVGVRIIIGANTVSGETEEERQLRSENLCYRVREIINQNWETIAFREKDYISNPKENGYQSLHMTVAVNYHLVKIPIEIQIRTEEMDAVAQYGPAAHTRYKEHFMDDLLANSFPANVPESTNVNSDNVNSGSNSNSSKAKKKYRRGKSKKKYFSAKALKAQGRKQTLRDRRVEKIEKDDPLIDALEGVSPEIEAVSRMSRVQF